MSNNEFTHTQTTESNLVPCVLAVWYYFGAVGSFIFILMQLILLVDFAHTWNQSWVEKAENGNSKCWYAGKITPKYWHVNLMLLSGPIDKQ